MRTVLQPLFNELKSHQAPNSPLNAAWIYEYLALIERKQNSQPCIDVDKAPQWFELLEKIEISSDYKNAYEQWFHSLMQSESRAYRIKLASRMILGHGLPSPTEVGISMHRTWSVPIITGTALKGLLSHYIQTTYGPQTPSLHPNDPNYPQSELARASYQGVIWENSRIKHGPGDIYRILFGAPDAESDDTFRNEQHPYPIGASQGYVTFHDALFVPDSVANRPFCKDVLTVHQQSYYKGMFTNQCGDWPNDYDSPNPVSFLAVKTGAEFLIALSGPDEWTDFAAQLLRDALISWGIGGKTNAGYGQIDPDIWQTKISPEQRQQFIQELEAEKTFAQEKILQQKLIADTQNNQIYQDLIQWYNSLDDSCSKMYRIQQIQEQWLDKFLHTPQAVCNLAWEFIKKNIPSNKRTKDILSNLQQQLLK